VKTLAAILLLISIYLPRQAYAQSPSVRLCAPLCLNFSYSSNEHRGAQRRTEGEGNCARIVSLAPSISEVVIELGLGKNLVGVTRFDRLPEELSGLARIGGYMDLNLEQVQVLKPTVVIGFSEHVDSLKDFSRLGLKTVQVEHRDLEGITASIGELGNYCGAEEQARSLTERIDRLESEILAQIQQERDTSPRVLVLLGYPGGELFASGTDGFYSAIIDRLGAQNALGTTTRSLGALSPESVIHLNPDVIFHISGANEHEVDRSELLKYWGRFSSISAVKAQRIYTFHGYDFTIPGPNYPLIMQQFARALYGIS